MIAGTFYRRGIIETWGRGTLKIARLMREAGLEPPVLSASPGAVIVTFWLSEKTSVETSEKASEKTSEKTSEKILNAIRQNKLITIAELAATLGVTPRSIERNLQNLQNKGALRRVGPDKGGHWEVLK
jgi:ATP-dependent DNA helicase RecG